MEAHIGLDETVRGLSEERNLANGRDLLRRMLTMSRTLLRPMSFLILLKLAFDSCWLGRFRFSSL